MTLPSTQFISLQSSWREAWSVPAKLNPWRWAEANITMTTKQSEFTGKFSTALNPYIRLPAEKFIDPYVRKIVLCFGAQTGKTQLELIMMGYAIAEAPGNMIFLMPSKDLGQKFSETRFQPMVNDCPELARHKMADKHKFNKTHMEFDRMVLDIVGANSPANLASRPAKYVFADETSKYPENTKGESSPLDLIGERMKRALNSKFVMSSTPFLEKDDIWTGLLSGNHCRLRVRCPKCRGAQYTEGFFIESKNIRWNNDIPIEDMNHPGFEKSVHLECPAGHKLTEQERRLMVMAACEDGNAGGWTPTNINADPAQWSFHLPEFYSTFPGPVMLDLAKKWRDAIRRTKIGDYRGLQNIINSSFAEPWRPEELMKKREPKAIMSLRDDWRKPGEVPSFVAVQGLTAGVDTQANHFVYVIRAWADGDNMESFLVREGTCETFEGLSKVLFGSVYRDDKGREYIVDAVFMDAMGDRTHEVYKFCRDFRDMGIRPTKGERKMSEPWKQATIDRYPDTKKPIPGGLSLYHINTQHYKDWLAGKMLVSLEDPGAFHLHAGIKDENHQYVKEMCAEYKDEDGFWVCPKGRDNHRWDCEVLALAAADMRHVADWVPVHGDVIDKEEIGDGYDVDKVREARANKLW